MVTQEVDRTRVVVASHLATGKRRVRQLEPRLGRRRDVLVAGRGVDEHDQLVKRERLLGGCSQLDVAVVRRVESASEEPDHGTYSSDSWPISTVAPRFAPASRSTRASSSAAGGGPTTRKPSSVRMRLQRRSRGWGR